MDGGKGGQTLSLQEREGENRKQYLGKRKNGISISLVKLSRRFARVDGDAALRDGVAEEAHGGAAELALSFKAQPARPAQARRCWGASFRSIAMTS